MCSTEEQRHEFMGPLTNTLDTNINVAEMGLGQMVQ